jgi:integrase
MFASFDLRSWSDTQEGGVVGAQLQLWRPEEVAATLPPAHEWRLREFLDLWFGPNHLEVRERGAVGDYDQAVGWWEVVTDDPRLAEVTQEIAARAVKGLRSVTSTRTGRGLATATQAKIVRHWQVLFAHAGPRFGRRGAYAQLIAESPWFEPPRSQAPAKGTWTWPEARAIAAACALMQRPAVESPAAWWRVCLGTLYYFGIRDGQLLALRLGSLDRTPDGVRLVIEAVEKTGKRLVRRCPEAWVQAVEALHGPDWRDAERPLLPWPGASRGRARQLADSSRQSLLVRWHGSGAATARARRLLRPQRTLQDLAGIPLERQWELHAWRRLHVRLRSESGAAEAIAAGTLAAQHSSSAVTRDHYYDAEELTPLVIAGRFPLW